MQLKERSREILSSNFNFKCQALFGEKTCRGAQLRIVVTLVKITQTKPSEK